MAQQQQCSGMAGAMAAALLLLLLPGLRAEAADAGGLAPAVYAEVASRTCTYDRKIENGGVTWRGWWAPQMKVDADCTAFDIASWGYHFGDAGARAFATALVQVPELVVREVRLPQNRMSDLGAEALAWALVNRSRCNLAVLDLQGNDFGEPPVALISTLGRCPGLRALNLSSTRLSNGSVQALLTLLPRAPATGLAALALSGNRLGDAGAAAVAKALVSFPMLEELRLANNNISAEGLGALASALSVAPRLATLDLSAVKAGAPEERGALAAADAEALAAALKALPELRDLSLDGRGLGDAGARSLAEGLRGAGKLTSLSLQMNGIGDAGSEALAEALAGTPRLARLELSANRIGTAGAKALAAALRRTPELEELFLGGSGNALGEAGAKELVGALGGMPRLATLRLQSPGLGGAVRELAGAVAARAPALRTLGLETDRLSNAAAEALATAAAVPLGLELLELGNTSIKKAGWEALASAVVWRERLLKENGTALAVPGLSELVLKHVRAAADSEVAHLLRRDCASILLGADSQRLVPLALSAVGATERAGLRGLTEEEISEDLQVAGVPERPLRELRACLLEAAASAAASQSEEL